MGKFIDFFQHAGKLKVTKRTGWIMQGVKNPESVAEHSYRLSLLAMILAEESGVNQLKLIKMALVHDLAEGIVGDIVLEKGSKQISSPEEKFKKESGAMKKIFSNLKEGEEYYNLWLEYEKQESKEAKLLKQLDKIEMVMQALEYEKEHDPKKLDEFWVNTKKYLKDEHLITLFNKLNKLRK